MANPYQQMFDDTQEHTAASISDAYRSFDDTTYLFDVPVLEQSYNQSAAEIIKPDADRDWNDEYQHLVEQEVSSSGELFAKYAGINALLDQFLETAKRQGETIISEVNLPVEQKSIRPVDVGGVAGGLKFFSKGYYYFLYLVCHLNCE